jgi:hypothetical protein
MFSLTCVSNLKKSRLLASGLTATVLVTLLQGCATQVQSDLDSSVDLHQYHSFQIEYTSSTDVPGFSNPLNAKRLRDAVGDSMVAKGFHEVSTGETPDCIISIATGSQQAVGTQAATPRVGLGWGLFGGNRGFGSSIFMEQELYTYNRHRIALDMYDAKTREPVWHAAIAENVDSGSGAEAEANIRQAVDALFAKFP